MTSTDLERANEINKEIRELESFIFTASRVWEGKLIRQEQRYIFKTISYGAFSSEEYFMNTDIKNKVLDVLRNHLEELKEELRQL